MDKKLVVTSSPHIRGNDTTQKIMLDVLIALCPALICATVVFGYNVIVLSAVCVASSVFFEYAARRVLKKENTISDLSAAVTGLLLAFNLPVNFPIWMAILGCFVAIVIVKQLFGGIGKNFANPAIVGRIFLFISFATPMTTWVIPKITNGSVEYIAGATPLVLLGQGNFAELPSISAMALGFRGGCIGETATAALFIGGIYLMIKKVITPTIPAAYLGTVIVMSLLFGVSPVYHILSGGVMLGAMFMATDYVTSPTTEKGKLIFGIGCGLITMVIRVFGNYPEGVSFAILLMNIVTPHIQRLTRTKPVGGIK